MKRTWLKSQATYTNKFQKIDKEKGILYGVKMVSVGEAKGHGVYLNSEFIDKTVELGKSHKNGVRARFGHPNMCNESLGTYLGVYKNVRREGESAIGDLYLSETAKKSPQGDLYSYVIELAEKHPSAFGSSIVFEGEDYEGELDGEPVYFATINKLTFTDLVGEPAATDGLFSSYSLSEIVTDFLEENPAVFKAYEKDKGVIDIFLNKYKMFKFKKNKPLKVVTFKSGEQVAFSGELEEGTELAPVELETLPDGDYTLDDGRIISIADGVVTEVKEAEMGDNSELEASLSAMFTTQITEMFNMFKAEMDELRTEFKALKEGKSGGKPPKEKPSGEQSSLSADDVLKNIKAKSKETFANLKKDRRA